MNRSYLLTILAMLACIMPEEGRASAPLSFEKLVEELGMPIVVASGYDIVSKTKDGINELSLFSVVRPATAIALSDIKRESYLIFSDDSEFKARVRYHFSSMKIPEEYTGSTMFASTKKNGLDIEIYRVDQNRSIKKILQIGISIVYLEEGAKGELIRKRTKSRTIK